MDRGAPTAFSAMIAAVVIASGYSRRMGRSKLSLELGGATFLERAVRAATMARQVGRCIVVVRPEDATLVSGREGGGTPVELLLNDEAAEGQSASIRLAAARLAEDPDCEAVIFSVVDQPFLTSEVFDTLAQAWMNGVGQILVASYGGQRGNPALFGRSYFGELQALAGDVGGREVIRCHPDAMAEIPMPDPAAGVDVDTWEEYVDAQARLRGAGDVELA